MTLDPSIDQIIEYPSDLIELDAVRMSVEVVSGPNRHLKVFLEDDEAEPVAARNSKFDFESYEIVTKTQVRTEPRLTVCRSI